MDPAVLSLMQSVVKDKDACGLMATMFQSITNDMKVSQPLWEEFVKNAGRLHSCLKTTLVAICSYLDSFQRIADSASSAKGASRDIGTTLTRMCLRQRVVEAKLKTFASALAECLILPLQEKLDDWRRAAATLDKDHAREYKRQRADLKKRAADSLRLQKKVRKARTAELQRTLEAHSADLQERYQSLETSERSALAAAMVEERSRYCRFVACLQPVVEGEVAVIGEMVHLSEVMTQLEHNTQDPFTLPAASEQVIGDLKGAADAGWRRPAGSSPPSPCSGSCAGSRKSSVCSVSSAASCGSAAVPLPPPPPPPPPVGRPRSLSQAGRPPARAVSASRDSGFTSQDTLCARPAAAAAAPRPQQEEDSDVESDEERWQPGRPPPSPSPARPHTISSAYERGGGSFQRPSLAGFTFLPPRPPPAAHVTEATRPAVPAKPERAGGKNKVTVHSHYAHRGQIQLPDFNQAVPHMVVPQPVYSNLAELGGASDDCVTPTAGPDTPTTPTGAATPKFERCESDGSASSGYGSVQTAATPATDAFPPPPDFVLNNFSPERDSGRPPAAPPHERAGGLRRCLSQLCRPPPPVRRFSGGGGGGGGWRPPRSAVSAAVRSLTAAQHRPARPGGLSSFSGGPEQGGLMEQIRRGTPLRHTLAGHDRSAPLSRT